MARDPMAFISKEFGDVFRAVAEYIRDKGSVTKADLTEFFKTIPDAVNPEWDQEMVDNHVTSAIANFMQYDIVDVAPMEGGGVLITWTL
jgi:hypothetical protein